MRIQNNIMAMNTHRQYTINNNAIAKSAEKLSSGYRINRAGDDAAGLAISEKMRAQIRGLSRAGNNSQDAISLIQTAEGALQEVHSMLQRMNELANQAATGTNEDFDRDQINAEFNQLKSEIDQVAMTTNFNNMPLLDGSLGANKSVVDGTSTMKEGATLGTNEFVVTKQTGLSSKAGTYEISVDGDNINVKFTDANTKDVVNTTIKADDALKGDLKQGGAFKLDLSRAGLGTFDITAVSASPTKASLLAAIDGKSLVTKEAPSANAVSDVKINLHADGIEVSGNVEGGTIDFTATATGVSMNLNGAAVGAEVEFADIKAEDGSSFETDADKAVRNANKTFTIVFNDGANDHTVTFKTGSNGATVDDVQNYLKDAYASASSAGVKADVTLDAAAANTAIATGAGGTEPAVDLSGLNLADVDLAQYGFAAGDTVDFEFRDNNGTIEVWATDGTTEAMVGSAASANVTGVAVGGTATTTELDFGSLGTVTITGHVSGDATTHDITAADLADFLHGESLTDGAATAEAGAFSSSEVMGLPEPSTSAAAGGGLLIQVGANEGQQLEISVEAMSAEGLGIANSKIDDQTAAGKAITATQDAINKVSEQRAQLGAMQNRLEHKIANLDNTVENLQAAESRIRDVDIAKEMSNFTKNNILSQASTAMLAQANAAPQGVLSLLQ